MEKRGRPPHDTSPSSLGAALLREFQKKRSLTQGELGEMLDIGRAQLSRYMLGQRVPELKKAVEIERRTGIPVSSWLTKATAIPE